MHSLSTILVSGVLASLALAVPIPQATSPKKGFTVTGTVPKPLPAYPVRIANVYKKYGKPVPGYIAAAASGTGSVPAVPEQSDVAYLSEVTIGGQTLNLDFDTGSADLWVFSSELSSSVTSGHSIYDPSKSKTAKKLTGSTWKISYGDGSSASGDVYTDTVTVGGISVTGQDVELAKTVSSEFTQDQDNDGLLGLAFSSINTVTPKRATTWFDTGIAQNAFAQNLFTVDFKSGAPGTYDFGYIDDSKYSGQITYTDVDSSQGFWQFTGTGYGIGTKFTKQSITAIADTGTTLLLMDDTIVEAYYKQITGAKMDSTQGGYVFPCSATLPDFTVGIGSGKSVIPGTLMSLGSVGSNNCFGGLQSNQGLGMSIYGDVWLKAAFAVFDADNTRFGWAPKAGATSGSGSSSNSTGSGDTGNGDGSDSGNGDGSDSGNGDGSDNGNDNGNGNGSTDPSDGGDDSDPFDGGDDSDPFNFGDPFGNGGDGYGDDLGDLFGNSDDSYEKN